MGIRKLAKEWAPTFAVVLVLLSARSSIADYYSIPTGSMTPTVQVDDMVLVDKTAYCVRAPFTDWCAIARTTPAHGDVVVLDSPDQDKLLLKRIIAIPGDVVSVRNGRAFIHGQLESSPFSLASGTGPDFGPTRLGEREYLVLGDNRGDSHDGRSFGLVPQSSIKGKATAVIRRGGSFVWKDL